MIPYERVEPNTLLVPVGDIKAGQLVVIRAHGRFRYAVVERFGQRFVMVAYRLKQETFSRPNRRRIRPSEIYVIAPSYTKEELIALKAQRVYETTTHTRYDKKLRGPDRLVPLQI
jgi:hypothetical protein